jgi:predicted ATP-grasp superfamily ATP-dependent carboligase
MNDVRILVTDGDQRPALAITRSLGRRGLAVLVGEERPASLASSSKYCAGHVTYPSPYRTPEAFESFLRELVERKCVDVVIPVTDVTTHLVARNLAALKRRCATAMPTFKAFDSIADKWRLMERAESCGIPTPRTHLVNGIDGLGAVIDRVDYPAVVKPIRSRIRTDTGWLSTSVQYASSRAELRRLYDRTDYLATYPSLIQQRIVGPGLGVFVLCSQGQVLTAFAHRRLREKPPSGGVSVLCESVALDPELRAQAMRLLGPLGWHGVAMMEYKQDRRTGKAFLMEVNGRFWGSLQLAIDAGVDFPYLTYQLATGRPPDLPGAYKVGLRSRWLLGDVDHLWLRLFHRGRELEGAAPSRFRTLREFLKCAAPGLRYDVFGRDDLHPMCFEMRQYAQLMAGSALRGVRSRIARMIEAPHLRPAAEAIPTRGKNAGMLG